MAARTGELMPVIRAGEDSIAQLGEAAYRAPGGNAVHVYLARKDEEVRADLFSFFVHGRLNDP